MFRQKKLGFAPLGFTLIELLVVIGIIAILSTLAFVALQSSRAKSRNAKRVAEIKAVQTGLEQYFNNNSSYPTVTTTDLEANVLPDSATGATPWSTFLPLNPKSPRPADGTCTLAKNSYRYASTDGTSYTLDFCLGSPTGSFGTSGDTAVECTATVSGTNCN